MSSVKNTSFLEAVAAGIQHEKDFFDFCMKVHDELKGASMKAFFFDLANDSVEHVQMIEGIYTQFSGSNELPNLKHLSQVHKFHATAIQKLIKKLDRNLKKSAMGDELEALRLALQETQDAAEVFAKLADKFPDTGTKMLFQQMSNFNKQRSVLLEGSMVYQHPKIDESAMRDYHDEVIGVKIDPEKRSKTKPVKKSARKPAKKAIKKTAKKKVAGKKTKTVKKPAKKKKKAK